MLAKILDPSKRGADYQSITYERSGTVVTHDCIPTARMSLFRGQTPPRPTTAPSTTEGCPMGRHQELPVVVQSTGEM